VLPAPGDPLVGPASFDASYTPAWMQAGLCDYLQPEIFPLGLDVRGALSVRDGGGDYPAQLDEDAPIECHDGSLAAFADLPSVALCVLTQLQALLDADPPQGSLSRAFPPLFAGAPATCQGAVVPGLPEPPDDSDSDSDGESDSSSDASGGESDSGESDTSATSGGATEATSAGPDSATAGGDDPDGEGCGCRSDAQPRAPGLLMLGGLFLLGLQRRRRRAPLAALALAPAVTLAGCAGDDLGGTDTDASTSTTEPGTSTSTTSPGTSTSASSESDTDSDSDTEATTDDTDTDSTTSDTDTDTGGGGGELLKELSGSVWHGEQARGGKTRAYELRFDTDSLALVASCKTPSVPRASARCAPFKLEADRPDGALDRHPAPGLAGAPRQRPHRTTWTIELIDGEPRTLRTVRDGVDRGVRRGHLARPRRRPHRHRARVQGRRRRRSRRFATPASTASTTSDPVRLRPRRQRRDRRHRRRRRRQAPDLDRPFQKQPVLGQRRRTASTSSAAPSSATASTSSSPTPAPSTTPAAPWRCASSDDSVEDAVWAFFGDKAGKQ
jgi:MYXO-CTERM domain-containing protein